MYWKNKDGNINITFGYHDKDIDFPQKNYSDIKLLEFQCDSSDIETIIKELNILFDKIQKEVKKALKKYDSEYKNTPYFKDLLSINYKELNALYDNGDFALISTLINKTNKI